MLRKALPLIPIFLLWNLPFAFHAFVAPEVIIAELISLELAVFSIFAVLFNSKRTGSMYLSLTIVSVLIAGAFLISGGARFIPFYIASALIAGRYFLVYRGKGDAGVGSASALILLVLLILSTSLRFFHLASFQQGTGYAFSIYDDTKSVGIPLTYAYGIVIALGPVSLTISPVTAILFPLIAYLTADNTFLILDSFRPDGVSSISGIVVTSIACQCENTIGIISSTASSLALSILPYFIFLSVILLSVTNIYLRRPWKMKALRVNRFSILALLLSILTVEFIIVYSGMIYDLAVFGFNSFLTLLSGFLLGEMLRFKRKFPIHLLILAFAIQTVLFSPQLIRYALVSPLFFETYSAIGMAAGFLISISFSKRDKISRLGMFEFVFSMETMIAAVLLYLTIFSSTIYSGFPEIAVINFSVLILLLSLPAMWFSNIYLLSARASATGS